MTEAEKPVPASRPPLYAFAPTDPALPGIEVQRLDTTHILHRLGLHRYRFMVMIYFTQGGGWHRVGMHRWQVAAGDLAIIAPGEVYDATELGDAQGWIVLFTLEAIAPAYLTGNLSFSVINHPLLRPFAHPLGTFRSRIVTADAERPAWEMALAELAAELRQQPLAFREAAQARLILLLIQAARTLTQADLHVLPHEQAALGRVFQVINDLYMQPITARTIADVVGLSAAYLTTFVRRLTGRTLTEWIMERRMIEACRLLLETDMGSADIAMRVGYTDAAYFARLFRRVCGVTPGQWRTAGR